jgi:hypothetical protein
MADNGFPSVGACRKLFWTCVAIVWSYNFMGKEDMFLGAMNYLKFFQEACVLVVG